MEVRFQFSIQRPQLTRIRRFKRSGIVLLALVLALSTAGIVVATDTFTDVPADYPFHDDINAIYGARITTGTSPTTYGPNDPTSRGAAAAFLHRGLPRVAYGAASSATLSGTFMDRGVLTIDTGGMPGGTGFVKLDANLLAFSTAASGCPCEVEFRILRDAGGASLDWYVTVNNDVGGVDGNASGSATWAVVVPTATTETFRLQAKQNGGTTEVIGAGALTALYVPFGSTGGDALKDSGTPGSNKSPE